MSLSPKGANPPSYLMECVASFTDSGGQPLLDGDAATVLELMHGAMWPMGAGSLAAGLTRRRRDRGGGSARRRLDTVARLGVIWRPRDGLLMVVVGPLSPYALAGMDQVPVPNRPGPTLRPQQTLNAVWALNYRRSEARDFPLKVVLGAG
jgi:hypothetical protein